MSIVAIREKETGTLYNDAIPYFCYDDGGADVTKSACATAAGTAANTFTGLTSTDYRFRRLSDKTARVEVLYKPLSLNIIRTPQTPPIAGTVERGFNFAMGGIDRTFALERVDKYPTTAPDMMLAINIPTGAGNERAYGVQLPPPPEKYWIRFTAAESIVTQSYVEDVASLVGATNDAQFGIYASESLCLVRANGSKRDNETWSLYFGFGYEPEVTGYQLGDFTISHKGFDYPWAYSFRDLAGPAGEKFLQVKPAYVYVDRILPKGDFDLLQLP